MRLTAIGNNAVAMEFALLGRLSVGRSRLATIRNEQTTSAEVTARLADLMAINGGVARCRAEGLTVVTREVHCGVAIRASKIAAPQDKREQQAAVPTEADCGAWATASEELDWRQLSDGSEDVAEGFRRLCP